MGVPHPWSGRRSEPRSGRQHDRLNGGPEPAVEGGGGGETGDPDPGAGRTRRGEMIEGILGGLEALVGSCEREQPGKLDVVLRDPDAIVVHLPKVALRLGVALVGREL